jgi:hypothetical protein
MNNGETKEKERKKGRRKEEEEEGDIGRRPWGRGGLVGRFFR